MTDRPDEPLSSEELIRRAREGLSAPRQGEEAERQDRPSDAGEMRSPEPPAAAPFDPELLSPPAEAPPWEPASPSPAEPAPPLPPTDPTPMLPDGFTPEAGDPVTAEPSTGRRLLANWRWIVAGVVGVLVVLSFLDGFLDGSKNVNDLEAGECFRAPEVSEVSAVEVVDCAEAHEFEVTGSVTLEGNAGVYPDGDAIFEEAALRCLGSFVEYTGITDETSEYLPNPFVPTRGAWDDGDQTALCTVISVDDAGNLRQTTGSARNIGR